MNCGFETQDLNEAAFIWSQTGAKLKGLKPKHDARKQTYLFAFDLDFSHDDLKNLILAYQNGETRVEPSDFVRKQNYLRDQLRAVRG